MRRIFLVSIMLSVGVLGCGGPYSVRTAVPPSTAPEEPGSASFVEIASWFPQGGPGWPEWTKIEGVDYPTSMFETFHYTVTEVYAKGSGAPLTEDESDELFRIAHEVINEPIGMPEREVCLERIYLNALPGDIRLPDGSRLSFQNIRMNKEIVKLANEKLGEGRLTRVYVDSAPRDLTAF